MATLWVGILVAVDLGLLAADVLGDFTTPYTTVEHGMFYASLGVFLLCMFLFKREVLVSERKATDKAKDLAQAYDELRVREAELAQAQRTAHLGSWSWEPATDRTTWSRQMAELFALRPEDPALTLETFQRYLHPDDNPRFQRALAAALQSGIPFAFDFRIVRRDGAVRVLHGRGNVEKDASGKVVRLFGTSQDVTDVRLAEDERRVSAVRLQEIESLKEVNQFKTQFLNTAAHELSTPLTPIRLQLHNLKSSVAQDSAEKRAHALELLERNVQRLSSLVQDLLEGARLQSNQLAIERKPVELSQLVREAVRNQGVVAQAKGVRIELQDGEAMWTTGDTRRLSQVVDNLLANAVKFTPAGKTVHVRCVRASGGLAVFVQDEGIGISPEGKAKLFQPFSQVHDTSQQTRAGTGLGLYISKGIIEAHGGRIGVESPGLGQGATFWFVLAEGEAGASQG